MGVYCWTNISLVCDCCFDTCLQCNVVVYLFITAAVNLPRVLRSYIILTPYHTKKPNSSTRLTLLSKVIILTSRVPIIPASELLSEWEIGSSSQDTQVLKVHSNFLCGKWINVNPFASEAVYTRNFFSDRMSDSV